MISIPFDCFDKCSIVTRFWGSPAPRQNDNAFLTYSEFVREWQVVYRAFLDSQVKVGGLLPMKTAKASHVGLYKQENFEGQGVF